MAVKKPKLISDAQRGWMGLAGFDGTQEIPYVK
jgi:hypothetical protein